MKGKDYIMDHMIGASNFIHAKHKYRFIKKLKILVKILKFITDGGKVTSIFLKDAKELIIMKIGK